MNLKLILFILGLFFHAPYSTTTTTYTTTTTFATTTATTTTTTTTIPRNTSTRLKWIGNVAIRLNNSYNYVLNPNICLFDYVCMSYTCHI